MTADADLDDLIARARARCYSAAIADALDAHGLHRAALPPAIRPLAEQTVLCGRARTGIYMPIWHDSPDVRVYEHEIALVDDLKPGEVAVLACGGNTSIAPWGELLTTRARALSAAGVLTDGAVRDTRAIVRAGFPVFAGARLPLDTKHRGKMMMADVPVEIGLARIEPGDLLFGDDDGVVAVPEALIGPVLASALAKAEGENRMRADLEAGLSLTEAFARHGML